MAIVTSAEQLAGSHLSTYEEYWALADAKQIGSLPAHDAATFLKKSGLSDIILSKVWELSDTGAKGYLDKQGFFCALKLIALVQNGQEATLGNLASSTPPPNLGAIPQRSRNVSGSSSAGSGWRVSTHEKSKYDGIFQSLQPVNGKLPGDKVKPVLMNSNLPVDVLGKIWEYSDYDKDGHLDSEEFAVAMHLVYHSIEKKPLPTSMPADLIPPSQRRKGPPVGGVAVLPGMPTLNTGSSQASLDINTGMQNNNATPSNWSSPPNSIISANESSAPEPEEVGWVVSPQYQQTADYRFSQFDTDMDGLVNGAEIRDVLIQSGLNQNSLAAIWTLCDIQCNGFLNKEQFALCLWLIEEKSARGKDPPPQLTPEMIPPSMRSNAAADKPVSTELTKELLQIEAEIEEIKRRKIQLEADKQQKDADLKIRSGEVQTLQKEFEAINGTTMQLERQRGEAQKKLDELEDQKSRLDSDITEWRDKCADKQREIDSMREELAQQDRLEKNQTEELHRLKTEYSDLHTEANTLEKQIEQAMKQFDMMNREKSNMQLEIEQAKLHVEDLRKLNDNIDMAVQQYQDLIDEKPGAIEPDLSSLQEVPSLRSAPIINHNFNSSASYSKPEPSKGGFADFGAFGNDNDFGGFGGSMDTKPAADPFSNGDLFASASGTTSSTPAAGGDSGFGKDDPFAKDDPFKSADPFAGSDPFKESIGGADSDPFGGSDTFASNSVTPSASSTDWNISSSRPKSTDPFSSADPFGSNSQPARSASAVPSKFFSKDTSSSSSDPFDPFKSTNGATDITSSSANDPFGFDPFASDKATFKKPDEGKKKPPPRPALPRPRANTPTGAESTQPMFNADPFKMKSSPAGSRKGERPKAPTPTGDPFGGFGSDPFGGGSDPFGGSSTKSKSDDPFGGSSAKADPFAAFGSGSATTAKSGDAFTADFANFGSSGFHTPSKDKDLAWAAADSARIEEDRRKKLEEQEKADFEFALALSRAET